MVSMIVAASNNDSLPTSGLDLKTIVQLRKLISLINLSRKAYDNAARNVTDSRLAALAERTAFERHSQAVMLQSVLWSNGNESKMQNPVAAKSDVQAHKAPDEPPKRPLMTLVSEFLALDEQVSSCYKDVLGTIQGRGIRQLLSEQALQMQRLRKIMLDLRLEIEKQNSGERGISIP